MIWPKINACYAKKRLILEMLTRGTRHNMIKDRS